MLHRNDMFDSTGYIHSKSWLHGSGKYAFLWHIKSKGMKAFTQEQTVEKYVNDVNTDSKPSQQQTADNIMSEASAATTKETIEAIVALALKRDRGTAGQITCIARLPRAVRTIWSFFRMQQLVTSKGRSRIRSKTARVELIAATALDEDASLKLMTAKQLQADNIAKGVIIGHVNKLMMLPLTMFERAYDMFAAADRHDQYHAGLKDHVKDEISRMGKPGTLAEMRDMAIRTDGRYIERQLERGRTFMATTVTPTYSSGSAPEYLETMNWTTRTKGYIRVELANGTMIRTTEVIELDLELEEIRRTVELQNFIPPRC
ncbi:hypothetical protein V1520DRAFT_355645 [Lipomyces starkeyi]